MADTMTDVYCVNIPIADLQLITDNHAELNRGIKVKNK